MNMAINRVPVRRRTALALIILMAGSLFTALAGCSVIGDLMQPQTTTAENLEYQRITAVKFIEYQPDVERIDFTREGGFDGSGEWTTNAVVTVSGRTYSEILGPHEAVGDDLPDTPSSFVPGPVTVQYSDESSEVFR